MSLAAGRAASGVLDIRDVFAHVSDAAGLVLPHDAISLPVITEDESAIGFETFATLITAVI